MHDKKIKTNERNRQTNETKETNDLYDYLEEAHNEQDISYSIEENEKYLYSSGIPVDSMAEEIAKCRFISEETVVMEAIKRAVDLNRPNGEYAKSILMAWARNGISTLAHVRAVEKASNPNPRREQLPPYWLEEIPVWFKEELQQLENERSISSMELEDSQEMVEN